MFKRLPIFILFLVAVFCVAPTLRAGPLGAVVVSHDYDAAKNLVTLHMLNQSGKDITAYNILVRESYTNGRVIEHQVGQEMLGAMLTIADPTDPHHEDMRRAKNGGNGTWEAGTTREQLVGLQPGLTLATFEATLDTAIYADKTAETTNKDALNRLLADRKNDATTLESTSKVLRNALANLSDATPHETARKEIEATGKTLERSGVSGAVSLELQNSSYFAERAGKPLRDYLAALAAHQSHRAQLLREHANVTVGGAK
jgi:hypothetical protein